MKAVREIQFAGSEAFAERCAQSAANDAAGESVALAASDADLLQVENSQVGAAGSANPPAGLRRTPGIVALRATTLAGGQLAGTDPQQCGAALANLKQLIALATRLSAGHVTVEPAAIEAGLRYQDALNQTFAAVRTVIPDLERAGVRLCLRAAMHGFLMSPPEMRELLDGLDTSCVGADVDVNVDMALGRCDHASAEDWLTTLGARVLVVGIPQDAGNDWREPAAQMTTGDRIIIARRYTQPAS